MSSDSDWRGWEFWRKHAALIVIALTFVVLALHPIPECVACEYPNPWGRNDVTYSRDVGLLMMWVLLGPLLGGIARIRWCWLVPVGIAVADVMTQPIGGVSLGSLADNEGPVILILGIASGGFSLIVGRGLRAALDKVRQRRLANSQKCRTPR